MADNNDGGYTSRKFWFAWYTSTCVFLGALVAAKWSAFAANYQVMIGGVLGALGLYLGGNVAAKHIITKNVKYDIQQKQEEAVENPPEEEDDNIAGESC